VAALGKHLIEVNAGQLQVRVHGQGDFEVVGRLVETLKLAQVEEAALLENARKQASVSLSSIRDRVAKEAGEARELLKKQAEALSGDICEKILGRSL